ncbi:MAG: bifunctional 3-demethylubiquinol 3-O-methyltransferase/2-polyprenyl-6-hydroxyphenol methylase [Gammaproteobacteria bacterium RIFCSPHIGHO2_12_FULL_45_12]|nr:MAG: bifunctional 3-demethylubiquinol 3-O-methyltransferase/2-polyprenyl-6-hydroxyphenol methylase [Gammaproteobacteria bacterium RIFCSPHIGHO2_12_FULL_45_12]
MSTKQNYDKEELAKFAALAAHWWDTEGELKTLHQINPLRLGYIDNKVSLKGKSVIDIGCGGGILTESMAKLGALTTGIDLNQSVIDVAKLHLLESRVEVEYQCTSAESIACARPRHYDIVTCLEMLEHVPDPAAIVTACATLVKPGGHVFFSTLNRHPKAYLFAILGAEYLLKLLPKNTHDYAKFIRPAELGHWARQAGLTVNELKGMTYNPLTQQFKLTSDLSVNYLLYAGS